MENPPAKFFRLGPGLKTRLKHAYIIECNEAIKNDAGEVIELHCTYFPDSKSGEDKSGIKVKGVIHWLDAKTAMSAEVRLYDRLFNVENPAMEDGDFKDDSSDCVQGIFSEVKVSLNDKNVNLTNISVKDCPTY